MSIENVNTQRGNGWDALRALFRFAVFVFLVGCVLFVVALGGIIYAVAQQGGLKAESLIALAPLLTNSLGGMTPILSPLLQLFVVLVIIEWFLKRMGIDFGSGVALKNIEWNTQTIVAVIVIGAFAIAA